ncbi:MAG: hypothetical protein WCJ64_12130, partial [Rhodospirillaceae bacterium]
MSFYESQGFSDDPFESTNAGEEPLLGQYFVPPPYFRSVLGDPEKPKSQVILAPRGGGKTAQRVMIEKASMGGAFLCVTYDDFPTPAGFKLGDSDLDYHIKNICTILLIAILIHLDRHPDRVEALSHSDKELVKHQIQRFLGTLSSERFDKCIKSLKNYSDVASDLWKKYGGVVATLVNSFGSIRVRMTSPFMVESIS